MPKAEGEVKEEFFLKPFKNKEKGNVFKLKHKLTEVMNKYCGMVRNEKGLRKGLAEVKRIRKEVMKTGINGDLRYNPAWDTWIDTVFMCDVGEVMLKCALHRKESRGAHLREDYPNEGKPSNTLVKGGKVWRRYLT